MIRKKGLNVWTINASWLIYFPSSHKKTSTILRNDVRTLLSRELCPRSWVSSTLAWTISFILTIISSELSRLLIWSITGSLSGMLSSLWYLVKLKIISFDNHDSNMLVRIIPIIDDVYFSNKLDKHNYYTRLMLMMTVRYREARHQAMRPMLGLIWWEKLMTKWKMNPLDRCVHSLLKISSLVPHRMHLIL